MSALLGTMWADSFETKFLCTIKLESVKILLLSTPNEEQYNYSL
jgi:hypothetical protein